MAAPINQLTPFISYSAVAAGLVCLVAGSVMAIVDFIRKYQATTKANAVLESAKSKSSGATLEEQGAIADALDSASSLANSLKDLDSGFRMLILSVAFFAIAAVAAGVDSVAAAVAK